MLVGRKFAIPFWWLVPFQVTFVHFRKGNSPSWNFYWDGMNSPYGKVWFSPSFSGSFKLSPGPSWQKILVLQPIFARHKLRMGCVECEFMRQIAVKAFLATWRMMARNLSSFRLLVISTGFWSTFVRVYIGSTPGNPGCNRHQQDDITLLGCPRKLGSMVSKWVITYLFYL